MWNDSFVDRDDSGSDADSKPAGECSIHSVFAMDLRYGLESANCRGAYAGDCRFFYNPDRPRVIKRTVYTDDIDICSNYCEYYYLDRDKKEETCSGNPLMQT